MKTTFKLIQFACEGILAIQDARVRVFKQWDGARKTVASFPSRLKMPFIYAYESYPRATEWAASIALAAVILAIAFVLIPFLHYISK